MVVNERFNDNEKSEGHIASNLQTKSDDISNDNRITSKWYQLIKKSHKPITNILVSIARNSAIKPKLTISIIIITSLTLLAVGLFTNFNVVTDRNILWAPVGSRPVSHYDWINDGSNFGKKFRSFHLEIHADGNNVVGKEGFERVYTALNVVRETDGYNEICLEDGTDNCILRTGKRLWALDEESAFEIVSGTAYPDGFPLITESFIGKPVRDDDGTLTFGQLFLVQLDLPRGDDVEDFEELALERILDLREDWKAESLNKFRVECYAERSFTDEFTRSIVRDIPLLPVAFIVMTIFTTLVFWKRDKVQSRSLLGFGAVVGVLLSIMTGFGLLFIMGVPFTSVTQILPFIMFGIGLDDVFIVNGSFYRTDSKKPVVNRIEEAVKDCGISITLTTLTSATAFALGCTSRVPAVYWLCLYAFSTIIIGYIYQLTFFIAILAIDEKRVMENRRDCLVCFTIDQERNDQCEDREDVYPDEKTSALLSERFMSWYSDKLLKPQVKGVVVLAFLGLTAGCAYSTSLLEQAFEFKDVLPKGSYITTWYNSIDDYTDTGVSKAEAYFRNEDQSDPDIQNQMLAYVDDLVAMKQINQKPSTFWLADFKSYVNKTESIQGLPFYEQFKVFFDDPGYNRLYASDIILDENGIIKASKLSFYMSNLDSSKVTELIKWMEDQSEVSLKQPINKGKSDFSFFTHGEEYLTWQFYSRAVYELISTAILGVVSVSVLSMLLMPHWTAVLFVCPFICILYIDLLGVLQLAGKRIDPVSYVATVMSIGLLVDFIVHVLLRYYEIQGDRVARTKEMLQTMGTSVLIGGISTFLGVVPLAFTSSAIFSTIFVCFFGLVILGIGHGLVLMPIVLSMVGPESR